jgi:hypothetical protein
MPSTFTQNLGLEKIATGEQIGSWGSTENLTYDLIDAALGGVATVTLPATGSSGAPNALPITDGAVSNGRNKFISFTSGADLGGTAYVQLTPNDAQKVVYVRNSLPGGRSIIFFQGTYNASNDYVLLNGLDAVLAFNGGGSGAVVSNVFTNLDIPTITAGDVYTTNITADSYVGAPGGGELPPDATTTVKGLVELATLGEVATGTDTARAVTPEGVAEYYALFPEIVDATPAGTTPSLDPATATMQRWALTGNSSPTIGSFLNGQSMTLQIVAGNYTVTWPTITWIGGSAPTLSTTGSTWVVLWRMNGVMYGTLVGAST